jgi:hypothetical protein
MLVRRSGSYVFATRTVSTCTTNCLFYECTCSSWYNILAIHASRCWRGSEDTGSTFSKYSTVAQYRTPHSCLARTYCSIGKKHVGSLPVLPQSLGTRLLIVSLLGVHLKCEPIMLQQAFSRLCERTLLQPVHSKYQSLAQCQGMGDNLTLTSCDAINSQILKGIDNAQEWHS